jgi:putative phosphoribosyl transferase
MRFRDRSDAGQRLGARLRHLSSEDLVVVGLPRGGVAVAAEVARILAAPLDVILVRKLGVPAQPELGMGAIGEGGARVINSDIVAFAHVSDQDLALVEARERVELLRRARRYRGARPRLSLTGRTAVVVDDGVATGSTARAACEVAKAQGAKRVVLAVPVAPAAAAGQLAGDTDEFISLQAPGRFQAIGEWYDDFSQTSDEEVVSLLDRADPRQDPAPAPPDPAPAPPDPAPAPPDAAPARQGLTAAPQDAAPARQDLAAAPQDLTPARQDLAAAPQDLTPARQDLAAAPRDLTSVPRGPAAPAAGPPEPVAVPQAAAGFDAEVEVIAGTAALPGHLTVPAPGAGIVVFAHGSGSSRHSPRNGYVAGVLHGAGLGTLLFDLLTPGEEADRANVFDTGLLARRLTGATRWLRGQAQTGGAPIGYFGASTGAAAALLAAAELATAGRAAAGQATAGAGGIAAVVSRGGRPDLAGAALPRVQAPTLLIVGGLDGQVLQLNRQAQARLTCEHELAVIPGATHLFEEPGTLEQAAASARDWFTRHLTSADARRPIRAAPPANP